MPEYGGILEPTEATFRRYGLTKKDWLRLLESQGYVCFVCKRKPKSKRLTIDHEHAYKWKSKPPEERKLYVRGLLCWHCNHYYLARGMSVERAQNVAEYLRLYNERTGCLRDTPEADV